MSDLATAVAIARVIQKGDTGDRGPTGDVGSRGERGLSGRDGHNGRDGTDGKNGVDGRDGNAGRDGVDGRDGQQGERGLPGRDGRDGKSINPRGPWNANVVYEPLDLVSIDGGSYVCTQLSKGSRPPGAGWMTSAEKGDRGKDGRDGYNGVSAPIVSVGGGSGAAVEAGYGIEITTVDGVQVIAIATALAVPVSGGFISQKGAIVVNPEVAWIPSKEIDSQSISGTGTTPLTNTTDRAQTLSATLTSDTTIGIHATAGTDSADGSTSFLFQDKLFSGYTTKASGYNSADILGLDTANFATGRATSRTFTPANQYPVFAWPTSFGGTVDSFIVNGIPSNAFAFETVTFTNSDGYAESYYVVRFTNQVTGTYAVQVI